MSTAAQILANRSNALLSTGPLTPEGKSRVARNATTFGLFSATGFIRPGEEQIFDAFTASYMAELSPETPLEDTLAREIVHAAWRLRRCSHLEITPPEDADESLLERLQVSIDRARASAHRTLHRALAELRRIQTERAYRRLDLPRDPDPGAILIEQVAADDARRRKAPLESASSAQADSAIQTQSSAPLG